MVGIAHGSTFKNLNVTGSISSIYPYIGGIVGSLRDGGRIENCTSSLNINYTDDDTARIGGIVGEIQATSGSRNSYIINCINTGNITSSDIHGGGCGGIAGNANDAIIRNCYNSGNVTGVFQCGGIVGAAASGINGAHGCEIENCGNTGTISISSTESTKKNRVGGIVGGPINSDTKHAPQIKCCFNSGTITNTDGTGKGFGIYGYESKGLGSMTNCYWLSGTCLIGMNNVADDTSQVYTTASSVLSNLNTLNTSNSTTYKKWKVSGNSFVFDE